MCANGTLFISLKLNFTMPTSPFFQWDYIKVLTCNLKCKFLGISFLPSPYSDQRLLPLRERHLLSFLQDIHCGVACPVWSWVLASNSMASAAYTQLGSPPWLTLGLLTLWDWSLKWAICPDVIKEGSPTIASYFPAWLLSQTLSVQAHQASILALLHAPGRNTMPSSPTVHHGTCTGPPPIRGALLAPHPQTARRGNRDLDSHSVSHLPELWASACKHNGGI